MSQWKKQIQEYFALHRQEMLDDLSKLIAIRSVKAPALPGKPFGEKNAEVLALALEIAKEKGFRTENAENYVGTVDLNEGETELGILAHLDIVPEGEGWTYPPFQMTQADGKIFGRGTADDKGPAIAAFYAMCAAREICPNLSKNCRLYLGTDEECGSSDIAYYFKNHATPPYVFSPDADFPLINIEKGHMKPTFTAQWPEQDGDTILTFHGEVTANIVPRSASADIRGIRLETVQEKAAQISGDTGVSFTAEEADGLIHLSALGASAHAAHPQAGNNAVTALLALLSALPFSDSPAYRAVCCLHELFPHGDVNGKTLGLFCEDEISHELTINFSILDMTPTGLRGQYDSRTPICADFAQMEAVLRAALAKGGISLDKVSVSQPHHTPESSPFVQTLLKVYTEFTGNPGYCIAIGGGTYVHHIEGGVAYGCAMPGVDNRMHGPDEFSNLDDLITSAEIFTAAILEICA